MGHGPFPGPLSFVGDSGVLGSRPCIQRTTISIASAIGLAGFGPNFDHIPSVEVAPLIHAPPVNLVCLDDESGGFEKSPNKNKNEVSVLCSVDDGDDAPAALTSNAYRIQVACGPILGTEDVDVIPTQDSNTVLEDFDDVDVTPVLVVS